MPAKPPRPPLPSLTLDDDGEADRIRDYARAKGLVATAPPAAGAAAPPVQPPPAPASAEPAGPGTTPSGPIGSDPTNYGQAPRQPAPRKRAAAPTQQARPAVPRPAPTRPWQAMFPDYLIDQLKLAAAEAGTAQKVIVLEALRAAGFRIDDIDLQDLRRR